MSPRPTEGVGGWADDAGTAAEAGGAHGGGGVPNGGGSGTNAGQAGGGAAFDASPETGAASGTGGGNAGRGGTENLGRGGSDAGTGRGGASGSGGTPGAGGNSGGSNSGGSAGSTCSTSMPPSDLSIDDLEDGDRYIRQVDGRHGEWSIANDGTSGQQYPTGTFFPASPGANTSHYAARTWGQGFTSWGAGLRVTLEANGQSSCRYDASSTTGLGLYTKGTGTVTLSVATAGTVPPELGGTCNGACYDYHAMKLTLSSNWTHYEMAWSQLSQQGWGTAVQFDPTAILYIEFEFGTNVAFDIYVDDLKFLK